MCLKYRLASEVTEDVTLRGGNNDTLHFIFENLVVRKSSMLVVSPFIISFFLFLTLPRNVWADSDVEEMWAKSNFELLNDLAWWKVSSEGARHLASHSYLNETSTIPFEGSESDKKHDASITKSMVRRALGTGNSTVGTEACERAPTKSHDDIQVWCFLA